MEDRFTIEKLHASRKSAKVYIALDQQEGGSVRIKRMLSDLPPDGQQGGCGYLKILSRIYGDIKDDSLVGIVDYGVDDDGLWVATPHSESTELLNHLTRPMELEEFERMATQLLGVLAKAHRENLCHGAVSPNGIDVVQGNSGPIFRFTDLGFRKLHQIIQNSAIISTLPAEPAITAPELFDLFEEADAASDVYMIGQVFYMMLAGGHPWGGYDQNAVVQAQQDSKLPGLAQLQSSIPENLSSWIHSLLNLDPLRRPKDAAAALASMPSMETKAVAALNSVLSEVATQDRLSNSFVTKPLVQKSKKSRKASPLLWCSVSALVLGALSIVVVQLVKSSVENEGIGKVVDIAGYTKIGGMQAQEEEVKQMSNSSDQGNSPDDKGEIAIRNTGPDKQDKGEGDKRSQVGSGNKDQIENNGSGKDLLASNNGLDIAKDKSLTSDKTPFNINPNKSGGDPPAQLKVTASAVAKNDTPQKPPVQKNGGVKKKGLVKLSFDSQNVLENMKLVSSNFQPLKKNKVTIKYSEVGSFFVDDNWSLFQFKGRSKTPMAIDFSHPVRVDSFDVANHFPNASEIKIAAFGDLEGKNLLGKFSISVPARENGSMGKDLNYQKVKKLHAFGYEVSRLIILGTSEDGPANAHLDNLAVSIPDIKIPDEDVREDGIYTGEIKVTQSCRYKGDTYNRMEELTKVEGSRKKPNIHTTNKPTGEAWIQADLLERKSIRRIRLLKRPGHYYQGDNLVVLVSNDGKTWEVVVKSNGQMANKGEEWFDVDRVARYVRFRNTKRGVISLQNMVFKLAPNLP